MKVADLQQFLGAVTPLARAAGASDKSALEIDRARQCMEPFKDKTLAEFSEFLCRADEFDRTGKLTIQATPKTNRSRAAKTPAISIDDAVQLFAQLRTQATDPAITFEIIDEKLKPLEKLTVPQLKLVAAQAGVTISAKTKKPLLAELAGRIKELKASFERTQSRFGT